MEIKEKSELRSRFEKEMGNFDKMFGIIFDLLQEKRFDQSVAIIEFRAYADLYALALSVEEQMLELLQKVEMYS